MKQSTQRPRSLPNLKHEPAWRVLAEFSLNSTLSLETALAEVSSVGRNIKLPETCCERLALAVAKSFQTDTSQDYCLVIRILTSTAVITADLLSQEQGWGFFLVEKGANNNPVCPACQEIDLFLYLEGEDNDNQAVL